MVLFAEWITNRMGFGPENRRLKARKSGQRDRDYDFPRQPADPIHYHNRRYGGPRPLGRRMPLCEEIHRAYRDDGHGMRVVEMHQLDGRRIDNGQRNRPHHCHHAPIRRRSLELDRDFPDWRYHDGWDFDEGIYDPYQYRFDDESILDSFDNLSLGRRPSYERFRPVGHHDHRQFAPHPHFPHHQIQDYEEPHHHDRHRHHLDHQHQHAHSPHRGHHGHHGHFDGDDIHTLPGVTGGGGWRRDHHRIGDGVEHGRYTDESSDHGSTSTW